MSIASKFAQDFSSQSITMRALRGDLHTSTVTRRTAPTCIVAPALRMGPRPHRFTGSSYPDTAWAVTDLVQLARPLKSKLFHIYRSGYRDGVHVSIFCNTCLPPVQPNDNEARCSLPGFQRSQLFIQSMKDRRDDATLRHVSPRPAEASIS